MTGGMPPAVYTADELAAMLGVNRKTVYEAAERNEVPHRRIGRRLLFPRLAVDAWLAAVPERPPTTPSPKRRQRVRRSPRAKPPHRQD